MIHKINLQMFAGGAGGEDRTEKATPKKRREARQKGQVFQSREITTPWSCFCLYFTEDFRIRYIQAAQGILKKHGLNTPRSMIVYA